MTLIIGIKCKDGIVMGSDGAATLGAMGQSTIVQPFRKLETISNTIILGVSGPVGIGQIFKGVIKKLWDEEKFKGKKESYEAMEILSKSLWEHLKPEFQKASITKSVLEADGIKDSIVKLYDLRNRIIHGEKEISSLEKYLDWGESKQQTTVLLGMSQLTRFLQNRIHFVNEGLRVVIKATS